MHFRFGVDKSDFSNSGNRPLRRLLLVLFLMTCPLQLVHNTVTTDADIDFAKEYFMRGFIGVFVPMPILYIESKLPDFALFYNRKCRITIGTDSNASNKSL